MKEITQDDNWGSEDKLDRKASAVFLTNFLTGKYSQGRSQGKKDAFVLSVRSEWGFGKTFFIKRWMKDLKKNNYPVVYFDAWANDFSDDPLVGFVDELNDQLSEFFHTIPTASRVFSSAIKSGKRLIKPLGMGVAAILTKQLVGISIENVAGVLNGEPDDKSLKEQVDSLIDASSEAALQEHRKTKEIIKDFREKISHLIDGLEREAGVQLPIFIFIDELDRCRPTYAIELLESIKHIFGVEGVYFVVATNINQLMHSIKVVYGADFDSERYLLRFFDGEYSLPKPDAIGFSEFLFQKHDLSQYRNYMSALEDGIYDGPMKEITIFSKICDFFDLSLRDREQVASALFAALSSFGKSDRVYLDYLIFLIALKHFSSSVFEDVVSCVSGDIEKIRSVISKSMRADVEFMGWELVSYSSSRKVAYKLLDLFCYYSAASAMTIDDLSNSRPGPDANFPERVLNFIDPGRTWTRGQKTSLAGYAARVRHAGQMF